jgi:hypothetical protein
MKELWIVVLLFLNLQVAYCTNTNIAAIVEKYIWYPIKLNFNSMTGSEREAFILEFRKHVDSREARYSETAKFALVRLGDTQTVERLAQDLQSGDRKKADETKRVIERAKSPMTIPGLAALLYLPEEVAVRYDNPERDYYTQPLAAALMINEIIGKTEEFSPEVKSWLDSAPKSLLEDSSSPYVNQLWGRQRDIPQYDVRVCISYWCIRRLWEENKEAFLRHDYPAVKPPKTVRLPGEAVATNKAPSAAISVLTKVVPPAITPTQAAPKAIAPPPVTPLPTETTTKDWTTLRIVGVVVLALALIGFLVWRVRRR